MNNEIEQTKNFIYNFIKKYNVNVGASLPEQPFSMLVWNASPVVKNNIASAINELINQGILSEKNNSYYLTEEGYRQIYL